MRGYSSELKEPPAGRRRNRLEDREAVILSLPTSLVQRADVRQWLGLVVCQCSSSGDNVLNNGITLQKKKKTRELKKDAMHRWNL